MDRSQFRQRIIDFIESKTGTLRSMPYDQISTRDLIILQIALNDGLSTKEYWQYMNLFEPDEENQS